MRKFESLNFTNLNSLNSLEITNLNSLEFIESIESLEFTNLNFTTNRINGDYFQIFGTSNKILRFFKFRSSNIVLGAKFWFTHIFGQMNLKIYLDDLKLSRLQYFPA